MSAHVDPQQRRRRRDHRRNGQSVTIFDHCHSDRYCGENLIDGGAIQARLSRHSIDVVHHRDDGHARRESRSDLNMSTTSVQSRTSHANETCSRHDVIGEGCEASCLLLGIRHHTSIQIHVANIIGVAMSTRGHTPLLLVLPNAATRMRAPANMSDKVPRTNIANCGSTRVD